LDVIGLLGGLAVSVFSKPLALLIGLLVLGSQVSFFFFFFFFWGGGGCFFLIFFFFFFFLFFFFLILMANDY